MIFKKSLNVIENVNVFLLVHASKGTPLSETFLCVLAIHLQDNGV